MENEDEDVEMEVEVGDEVEEEEKVSFLCSSAPFRSSSIKIWLTPVNE